MQKAINKQIVPILDQVGRDWNAINYRAIREDALKQPYINMYVDTGSWFAENTFLKFKSSFELMKLKQETLTEQEEETQRNIFERAMIAFGTVAALDALPEITNTVRVNAQRLLEKIIEKAVNEGLSYDSTAKLIQKNLTKEFRDFSKWEAKRIARTEVHTAVEQGKREGVSATGKAFTKSWITGGTNIRETHI